MQTTTKLILAICCIGAVAVETLTPHYAQRWNTWNGCRPGWTVQGGRGAPDRWGGSGYGWGWGWNNNWRGGWNTWNDAGPVGRSRVEGWKMRALPIRKVMTTLL